LCGWTNKPPEPEEAERRTRLKAMKRTALADKPKTKPKRHRELEGVPKWLLKLRERWDERRRRGRRDRRSPSERFGGSPPRKNSALATFVK